MRTVLVTLAVLISTPALAVCIGAGLDTDADGIDDNCDVCIQSVDDDLDADGICDNTYEWESTEIASAAGLRSGFTIDLDGDGDDEAIFCDINRARVAVYDIVDGVAVQTQSVGTLSKPTNCDLSDVDGDGDLDVVYAGEHGWEMIGYMRNDDGVLSYIGFLERDVFGNAGGVHAVDVDSDGDEDLVIRDDADEQTWLMINEGNEIFSDASVIFTYARLDDIDVGDIDNDGLEDLFVLDDSDLFIHANNGAGGFDAAVLLLADLTLFELTDLDADGQLDVVMKRSNEVQWLRGVGDGSFEAVATLASPEALNRLHIGDVDNDGALDLVTTSQDGNLGWFHQVDGGFGPQHILSTTATGLVITTDLDGDGTIEILGEQDGAVRHWDGQLQILTCADDDGDGACNGIDICSGDDAFGDSDLDGVCDDTDLCYGDDGLGDSDLDGTCDDLDICATDDAYGDDDSDGWCNVELSVGAISAGTTVSLTAENVPEGATVWFLTSRSGIGGTFCHPSIDVCSALVSPRFLGNTVAGADGTATVTATAPARLADGISLYFEAVWLDGTDGEISDVVEVVSATP